MEIFLSQLKKPTDLDGLARCLVHRPDKVEGDLRPSVQALAHGGLGAVVRVHHNLLAAEVHCTPSQGQHSELALSAKSSVQHHSIENN